MLIGSRYEVLRDAGRGAEGRVLQAVDRRDGTLVALKLRRDVAAGRPGPIGAAPPEPRDHPALPRLREWFVEDGHHCAAFDWIEGDDLESVLRGTGSPGLPYVLVASAITQVAGALETLHRRAVPVHHGDVKPGNILLTVSGRFVLIDLELPGSGAGRPARGTSGYRAPEVTTGTRASRAGDVYALAATAFCLLTGSPPDGRLPSWAGHDAAVAARLETVLRHGLATDPARRPDGPLDLAARIAGAVSGDRSTVEIGDPSRAGATSAPGSVGVDAVSA